MYAATEDGFWALRQRLIEEKETAGVSVLISPGDRIPRVRLIEELLRLEAMGVQLVSVEANGHPLEIALTPENGATPSDRGEMIRQSMARKALRGVVHLWACGTGQGHSRNRGGIEFTWTANSPGRCLEHRHNS